MIFSHILYQYKNYELKFDSNHLNLQSNLAAHAIKLNI
jgi:hypothetical protein